MSSIKRLSPPQSRKVNSLVRRECCNCDNGHCILRDDGYECVCPQLKMCIRDRHRTDIAEVVNACDAGREGELMFLFVYEVAGCKKPMRRLWISSMEESAIKGDYRRGSRREAASNLYF